MNHESFIARRFLSGDKNSFSRRLVRIAVCTIALGVTVMVMSVCILRGFQREITEKVVGFGGHIKLCSYGWVNDYDEIPVKLTENELNAIKSLPGVASIQAYAYKGGMLKTDDQIHGIIFKGVNQDFDTLFFASNMVKGRLFQMNDSSTSNEIVVSSRMAAKMNLDTGFKARCYFWSGNGYRARAFTIVGVYNTDLEEFDNHYIVGDIRQVQKLNEWTNGEVAGYEVTTKDFSRLEATLAEVKKATGAEVAVSSIREEQPSLFAWLDLLNSNILLIIAIMGVVCAASVSSALLIMIFERTSMIGLLKTLGSTNGSIRRIFAYKSASIICRGILWGDAIALVLCLIQNSFHIIRLDAESYSMTFVPVDINPLYFIAISFGTLLVCMLALLLPSTAIAHVQPAKSIRVN